MKAHWTWAITGLSLLGVILNVKKRRECFYIWAFTNATWAIYDFTLGAVAQAALFSVYWILALWGIWEWRKPKHAGKDTSH